MSYSEVFDGREEFKVTQIESSKTGFVPDEIKPEYEAPAISINTGGRFVKHEIIGGATVRQRVGDEPLEISISGVCFESTANDLTLLRNAEYATLRSERFPESSITVHIVSIATDPMSDGGAAPIHGENQKQPELLYKYSIEAVEILDSADIQNNSVEQLFNNLDDEDDNIPYAPLTPSSSGDGV